MSDGTTKETVQVSGVWLRRSGDRVIVAVEIDGLWRDVIVERLDSNFSHIVESSGIRAAPRSGI
jgi:hypothetical protein